MAIRNSFPFDTLWHATAVPAAPTTRLEDTTQAETCIIGAGFTGLSTALELAKRGRRVVVLEAGEIGAGASGRNLGHSTPTFSHYSLPRLRRLLGDPWSERLIVRQVRANDVVADIVKKYRIDCEWVQKGYVMAAPRPDFLFAAEERTRLYGEVGAKTRVINRAESEDITGSPRFYGGWLHEEGGHLNPLGYARGLARAVISEGGAIYTSSKVLKVLPNSWGGWRVMTATGGVNADKVIFATGAYTKEGWPGLDRTYKVQAGFVAATQILPPEIRSSIMPFNTSITDGRGDLFGYKYDGSGRIVASMIPLGRRGKDIRYTKQILTDRLRWYYPQLSLPLSWDFLWFGDIDMQPTTVPRLYSLAPGVVAVTGLSGRGIPTGTMLGAILADWVNGVREDDLALKTEPLSAAPFYMAFAPKLMLRYYRIRDRFQSMRANVPSPPGS